MKQHTTWNFSAKLSDIDVNRILAEVPAECRVVRIEMGQRYVVCVRRATFSAASAAGIRPPTCDFEYGLPMVTQSAMLETQKRSDSQWACDWMPETCDKLSLDAMRTWLDELDAHVSELRKVTVTAL